MSFLKFLFIFLNLFFISFYLLEHYLNISQIMYDYLLPPISSYSINKQVIANEALLETTHLIQKYGYPAENHTVLTNDGYLITIHRIPRGKNNKNQGKIPIYLQHGAHVSSVMWLNNAEESLGFILADEGYDVWLGNFRENSYTKRLNEEVIDENEIFGWDKLSDYEVPAIVDYIWNATGRSYILAIGHSMGSTTILSALSTHPELNNKIKGFVALAPVSNIRYSTSIAVIILRSMYEFVPTIFHTFYRDSYFPRHKRTDLVLRACLYFPKICNLIVAMNVGYNPDEIKPIRLPLLVCHEIDSLPDSFIYHWFQSASRTYKMISYDYGKDKNLLNFNQPTPVEYDLSRIKIPVAIISAVNDPLSTPIDVEIISRKLTNLICKKFLSETMASHEGFFFNQCKCLMEIMLPVLNTMINKI